MRSKRSKSPLPPPSRWRAEPACSEAKLAEIACELAARLRPGDLVALEGPLGAGKTTFARALLLGLGVEQPPEGSPTFAIAHEYRSRAGEVIHIDFYRLRSEAEIEDAGLPAYFGEREAIVVTEWLSSWPAFQGAAIGSRSRVWSVRLAFSEQGESLRQLEISLS